jgi:N utilization substance protein B
MASYRHIARIAVMQTIFAYEFRGGEPMDILKYNLEDYRAKLTDFSFAENLLKGTLSKKKELVKVIQEEAPEWPVDKIAPVDRAILELGAFEILHSLDVPPIVAINEAVEIAKSFGDTNSPKFVNGVLSTIMHKYRKDALQKKNGDTEEKPKTPGRKNPRKSSKK